LVQFFLKKQRYEDLYGRREELTLVYDFISRAQVTPQKACHVHCDVNLSHMLAILVMYKISVITSRMQEDGFDIPPWTAKNLNREDLLSMWKSITHALISTRHVAELP
jgi:hypothetical protein